MYFCNSGCDICDSKCSKSGLQYISDTSQDRKRSLTPSGVRRTVCYFQKFKRIEYVGGGNGPKFIASGFLAFQKLTMGKSRPSHQREIITERVRK